MGGEWRIYSKLEHIYIFPERVMHSLKWTNDDLERYDGELSDSWFAGMTPSLFDFVKILKNDTI